MKTLSLIAIACAAFMLFSAPLLSLRVNAADGDITLVNPLGKNDKGQDRSLIEILGDIFKTMRTIMFVVVPIFIVVGAFQMMFAQGNPENFKKGQKTILYSVIGLVIIIMATGIVAIVRSILTL